MNDNPLVSICTLTYNQQDFIVQTVESLLIQQTTFPFEVVISDDGSTDDTLYKIKKIIAEHPHGNRIKLLEHENMGVLPNYIYTFKHCKGKYIAFCEGDDYWTDPKKLQIQADFLEKNPQYSICFHQVRRIQDNEFISNNPSDLNEKDFTINDLSKHPLMYTPSVMMNFSKLELPEWYIDSPLFDYPLQLLVSKYGKIKYIPLNMADYRVGTGIWTTGTGLKNLHKLVKLMTLLMKEFANDDKLFETFSKRRSEYEQKITEHNVYLSIYLGKANLSKLSIKSCAKLLAQKILSKII